MRFIIRHFFIFVFVLELGMLAIIFKPVETFEPPQINTAELAKTVAVPLDETRYRFPTPQERNDRMRKLMSDLSKGANATGLSDVVDDMMGYLAQQANAMIVSAPSSRG